MHRPKIVLVAAVARDGAIGRSGQLLWREAADQRRFRAVTLGAPVVMGRRTWESLPERFRPLPGRRNLVLTRRRDWHPAGAETVASWPEVLDRLAGAARVCVIGGAELYRLAIDAADELALTEVDASFDADTWFPAFDRTAYVEHDAEQRVDGAGRAYRFVTYRRRSGD